MFLLEAATELLSFNGTTESSPWNNQSNMISHHNENDAHTSSDMSQELADDLRFALKCVTMPILETCGATGNFLSLVVLLQRKIRRSSSTTVLLVGLAISDCLYLITTMICKSTCIISYFDEALSYKYFVLSFPVVYYTNTCFSRTVMSVERLMAVTFLLKAILFCTKVKMSIVILLVFVFEFGFLAFLTLQYKVKYISKIPYLTPSTFSQKNKEFLNVYNTYVTVIVLRWLPKLIVIICNVTIIRLRWKRRQPSESLDNVSTSMNASQKIQRNVTVMLVTVVIVFVATLLPGDAFLITSIVVDKFKLYGEYKNYYLVRSYVTLTFELVNVSVDFVIYMALNSSFSEVYLVLFCPCRPAARRLRQAGMASLVSSRRPTHEDQLRSTTSTSNASGRNLSSVSLTLDHAP